MPSDWLRINGVPATEIAPHTPVTYETGADGGCLSASFALALSARTQHRALRSDALVEVMRGPLPIWSGLMTEPDRTTWECHATGISSTLNDALALDIATGTVTRNIATALTYAQSTGSLVLNPDYLMGGYVASGVLPNNPESVYKLLDDYAIQLASRWGVDGRRVLYIRADPTVPTLMAAPGTALFGQTSERTPRRLAGRYFNGTTYETAFAGTGTPEVDVGDKLIERGTLSLIEAQVILGGILAKQTQQAWTNGATLHREQLTTMGGEPANFATTRGGLMLRGQGLAYGDAASGLRLDVVLGKTRYTQGADTIYVEPVNKAPRTQEEIIAQL